MVAQKNKINLPEIKKWAEKQGETGKYEIFRKLRLNPVLPERERGRQGFV